MLAAPAPAQQAQPSPASDDSPVREKDLPLNILRDQGFFWSRPFRAQREDWKTWALLAGGTAALLPLDSPTARALADSPPGQGYDVSRRIGDLSGWAVDLGTAGGFYLVGRLRADGRARETGLLGTQAVLNAVILTELLKTAAGRDRPTRHGGREPIDDADGHFLQGVKRSFPSGHALQAWALATVVAEEYRHNPWARYGAFGAAAFVSVARVTARKHFPSDIFVGSILGYLVGRHVYRAHHRVAPERAPPPGALPAAPNSESGWQVIPSARPGGFGVTLTFEF